MGKGGQLYDASVGAKQAHVSALKAGAKSKVIREDITVKELRSHNTVSDAWMSIGTKVYDVSNWHAHPGGSVIFTHAGDDMTDVFNMFHPPSAFAGLNKFYIGNLVADVIEDETKKADDLKQRNFERAYRSLRGKMIAAGLFKVSSGYYAYKFASQALLVAAAAMLAAHESTLALLGSALLLGVFWQQAGWLCHDICHNQISQSEGCVWWNTAFGLIFGNLAQGFSCAWWKDKHNRHHAVPNVHASGASALNGDPDIDTMPLLAWTVKMGEVGKDDDTSRWLISVQKWTYLPLLLFARLSWLQQGIQFAWSIKEDGIFNNATKNDDLKAVQEASLSGSMKYAEQILLILHHIWVIGLCSQRPTILGGIMLWLLANNVCGMILFAVTSLGHNGLPVYEADERPDYWKLQVTTTRNITGNAFVHWLCGGLEYQVDHHLFPTMPRHHLPKAHELIVSFCKEHEITYNEANLWVGTLDIIKHLDVVAKEFLVEFPAM